MAGQSLFSVAAVHAVCSTQVAFTPQSTSQMSSATQRWADRRCTHPHRCS